MKISLRNIAGQTLFSHECYGNNHARTLEIACAENIDLTGPPRQNSCRLDMMMDMGAIGNRDGTLRGSIQEPGCGAVVAAGKRGDWNGGQGGWRVAADTGTLA